MGRHVIGRAFPDVLKDCNASVSRKLDDYSYNGEEEEEEEKKTEVLCL
jgi:hypothetical protein